MNHINSSLWIYLRAQLNKCKWRWNVEPQICVYLDRCDLRFHIRCTLEHCFSVTQGQAHRDIEYSHPECDTKILRIGVGCSQRDDPKQISGRWHLKDEFMKFYKSAENIWISRFEVCLPISLKPTKILPIFEQIIH